VQFSLNYSILFPEEFGFNKERGKEFKRLFKKMTLKNYPKAIVKVMYKDDVIIEVGNVDGHPKTEQDILNILLDVSLAIYSYERECENRRNYNNNAHQSTGGMK
jgi:hypothetical protein